MIHIAERVVFYTGLYCWSFIVIVTFIIVVKTIKDGIQKSKNKKR